MEENGQDAALHQDTKVCQELFKELKIGNIVVKANLIQSLGFTRDIIKQPTNRVKEVKR